MWFAFEVYVALSHWAIAEIGNYEILLEMCYNEKEFQLECSTVLYSVI